MAETFDDLDWPNPVNWQNSLNRGLVCWHLITPNSGRGSVSWRNLVGPANPGVLTNMDPKTDWVANARLGGCGSIETDGSNDRVDCGTVGGLNGATYAAFSGWIYRASTGTTAGFGGTAGSSTTGANRWSVIWFSDGNIYVNAPSSGGNGRFGSAALTGTGWRWVYVQFIGDGGSDTARNKLWIDGVSKSLSFSGTGSGTTTIGNVSPWTIGRDSSNRVCGGGYDDIRLSLGSAALLTEGEIKALYRESLTGYPNLLQRVEIVAARIAAPASGVARLINGGPIRHPIFGGLCATPEF